MDNSRDKTTGRFLPKSTNDKFWDKVYLGGECWNWTGHKFRNGYGSITIYGAKTKVWLAHRLAWELIIGPIPDGMFVLHHCDNRACVKADPDPRKSHLFLGTQADNIIDMYSKGRQAKWELTRRKGEANGSAKLKIEQVKEIRRLFRPRFMGYRQLAEKFGVSRHTIAAIVRGVIWKYREAGYCPQ
jgi:DNA-binding XRE family transcriptional regulator